mgnify:CR=1 FL=1
MGCEAVKLFSFKNSSSSDTGSLLYEWHFGNNVKGYAKDTSITYATIGKYGIQLIARTLNNCRDTAIDSVVINPHPNAQFSINEPAQCYNTKDRKSVV